MALLLILPVVLLIFLCSPRAEVRLFQGVFDLEREKQRVTQEALDHLAE